MLKFIKKHGEIIIQILRILNITFLLLICLMLSSQLKDIRSNAMDLCAWHARIIFYENNPSDDVTNEARYIRVREGIDKCPFCGQLHNEYWNSKNAWESQISSMDIKVK